jgi:hypothetical protein
MSPRKPKQEVITFKVDSTVAEAMQGIPNRSEFIRAAILSAFENTCPLCKGMGILSPDQRKHWKAFSKKHQVRECDDCHAFHLVCDAEHKRWAISIKKWNADLRLRGALKKTDLNGYLL